MTLIFTKISFFLKSESLHRVGTHMKNESSQDGHSTRDLESEA